MPKIQCVIFDLDGVLVDACEWHYEALNRALADFGQNINRTDHLQKFDGLPTKKKLDVLSKERGLDPKSHDKIHKLKQIYTMELVEKYAKPVPAIVDALSKLKAQGYKLAVCSNAIPESIELMLRKSGILQFFDFTLSNKDVLKSKPDPEIYQMAMRKFAVDPKQCLILEDNEYGIQAATAAGGNLLKVKSVSDLNYSWIVSTIKAIEQEKAAA